MNHTNTSEPYSFDPTIVVFVECTTGVLFNFLLLVVIIRNPLANLRNRGWIPILNLAVADLITCAGTIMLLFYDTEERLDPSNYMVIKAAYIVLHIGYSSSFIMLLVLSIEVYIATRYPLRSHLILTKKKAIWTSVSVWFAAVLVASCNLWTRDFPMEILVAVIGVLEIAALVVIVLRIMVILNVRRSQRNIARLTGSEVYTSRLLVTFLLLFFVYMFTAFPFFVGEQIHFLYHSKPQWNIRFEHDFIAYYQPFAYINFIVNPFIYAWRIPEYRHASVALLTCRKKQAKPLAVIRVVNGGSCGIPVSPAMTNRSSESIL